MTAYPVEKAIARYTDYMQEIKHRTHVIQKVLERHRDGQSLTGYRESDIELCFLQLRKCLELLMFSSINVHYEAGLKLQSKIVNQEWNATKLLKLLERVNPRFYPRPMIEKQVSQSGTRSMDENTKDTLTRKEFEQLYDRVCGALLHASRTAQFGGKHDKFFAEIETWLDKLVRLINLHWIHLDDEIVLHVSMQTGDTGDVQVALFKKIDG